MSDLDNWLGASSAQAASAPAALDAWLGASSAAPASAPSAASTPVVPAAAPTPAPSTGQVSGVTAAPPLNGFLQGIGDKAGGAAQSITHGLSWLADKFAPDSQFAKDARQGAKDIDAQTAANNAAYEAARKAQGVDGFDGARTAGQILGGAPIFLASPAKGFLGAIAQGAGQGTLDALATPTIPADGQSYADAKLGQVKLGAALGGAIPGGLKVVAGTGRALSDAVAPIVNPTGYVGRGIANIFDPAAAGNVAATIRANSGSLVPGSLPTTAQVAENVALAQTEKAAGNVPAIKTALVERGIANNAARWAAINQVAGSDQALQAALAARANAARPAVDSLLTNGTPVSANPILTAIDNTLAGNLGTNPAIKGALNDMRNQITSRTSTRGNWVAPDVLDGLRQNAGDFIAQHSPNGVVQSKQVVAMAPIQDAITDAIEAANPGYKQYLADYAANSRPINTMEMGRRIADGLGGKAQNAAGDVSIELPAFRGQFQKAADAIPHDNVDPQALAAMQAVQDDLGRVTRSNSIRFGGSDTGYNLKAEGVLGRMLYGSNFEGAGTASKGLAALATLALGHPLAAAGVFGAGAKAGQAVGSNLNRALSVHMLNPDSLLPYLDARAAQTGAPGVLSRLTNGISPVVTSGLLAQ